MDEEEAALLAELRAISNRSASSSRFDNSNNSSSHNNNDYETTHGKMQPHSPHQPQPQDNVPVATTTAIQADANDSQANHSNAQGIIRSSNTVMNVETQDASQQQQQQQSKSPSELSQAVVLPPWKQGKQVVKKDDAIQEDVVVVTVAAPKTLSSNHPPPSTFTGDRGGDAHDPELLALLRGASSQSSRFDDEDNNKNNNHGGNTDGLQVNNNAFAAVLQEPAPTLATLPAEEETTKPIISAPSPSKISLPPWKRGKQAVKKEEEDADDDNVVVVVAAPNKGFQSDLPSTYTGDRGGDAHDSELLALLRAASGKTSSSSRFDDEEGEPASSVVLEPAKVDIKPSSPSPAKFNRRDSKESILPWKRGKQAAKTEEDHVVVEAPNKGFQSDLPSTFTGDRGGDAHDPELLALLRAASGKTSSSSRFGEEEGEPASSVVLEPAKVESNKPSSPSPAKFNRRDSKESILPWKRGKQAAKTEEDHVVVEAPNKGFQSDLPSTFTGDRGGDAHDPELLALLRAASGKTSSSSRFGEEEGVDKAIPEPAKGDTKPSSPSPAKFNRRDSKESILPWKRGKQAAKTEEDDVVVAAPNKGFQSDLPSTFKGDRGGDAHDPELLALLRAASGKTSSSSRFGDDTQVNEEVVSVAPSAEVVSPTKTKSQHSAENITNDPNALTRDDLPNALVHKDWKVRCAAFDLLGQILNDIVGDRDKVWDVHGDNVMEGLDEMIPKLLEESNAGALDKALGFVLLYGEHCVGAASPEHASAIVSALVRKNGFSGRPGTVKLASSVTLKLMEVGAVSSVNSVIDVLLVDGLASKKPKVVQAAVTLILDAALEFGAATLPLASITKASSKLMSHSNAKVRETGMKVLAEICRALGSKTPIQSTIDEMKPTQIKELDSLLENQPEASKPRTMFRTYQSGLSAEPPRDALAALQSGTAELEAQRYAARPTINLMSEVAKTEYVAKLGLSKWSEKVAALKIVLECAGEKPYKLAEQSSSCNYVSLINDMKKLLSHTHFAVVSNAMEVLGMLAEGVGEKLYSHLRLMLVPLLQLAKDKKLAKAVSSCLDSMFGNVLSFEHLLEREDALPDAVDEQKQKNALVRTAALDLLSRSVKRSGQAGPRSVLSTGVAKRITSFCAEKLEDSNADVRKAASDTLKALQGSEDPDIVELADAAIESLRSKNPRAHKALSRTSDQAPGAARGRSTIPPEAKITSKPASATTAASKASMARASSNRNGDKSTKTSGPSIDIPSPSSKTEKADLSMSLSSAIAHAGKLPIPLWGAAEEDGGILRGLESAKGIMRQDAIKSLTSFVESGKLIASKDIDKDCTALLTIVREHTRGFNETNVNIMKGIVQLFIAMCDVHEKMECLMNDWSAKAGTSVAVAKISDKKASDGCKSLLSALCVVCAPHTILLAALEAVQTVKTPVAHEELLKWIAVFCGEFGAAVLGPHLGDLIPFILLEVVSSNPKVKRESLVALGVIHAQLGGQFRALVLSLAKGPVRDLVEGCLDSYPFDSSQVTSEWPKISLAIVNSPHNSNSQSGLVLDIPKTDLIEELSEDTLLKLNSKDGKTAWKYRKEALEEIEAALKRCSGLIKTEGSNLRPITDLARLLEQRLSDTQINLKPIAASVIARLLSAVDASTQARVGKIVFSQLISAAMNDIKKPMRDNCLLALRAGVAIPSLDGGGINGEALEVLVASLIGQVNEVATRAGGLADVLVLMTSFTESLSNLDEVTSSRGQSLGERYAVTIVECLTSSKTETRAAATSLAELSIECGVVGMGSFRKATEKLKPAQQRTVGPLIAQFTKRVDPVSESGKENDESLVVPLVSRHRKGSSVGEALVSHEEKEKSKTAPVDKVKASKRHEREHESSSNQHPLLNRSGQASRHIVHKVLVWPEYPEEPQGASLLTSLKRAWSELLPGGSLSALFPASGINKQDDALDGCEILKQVIQLDRSNNKDVLIWQVDYALKWITVVLCSRETTVGLVAVLEVVEDLLKFLIERNHKLTDSDGAVCIPFLIEKAGTAKGRFRDKFAEIEMLIQDEQLLSTKQLGGFCVAVMEGSAQAKARASACRLCIECLERDGLVAMGKKGVLVAAKAVSDETIPENRSLALTLMMKILFRMNGEFTKLERICGPSLTNHGRQLLEERWARREKDSTEPTDSSSSGRKAKVTVNGELKQTGTAGEGTATLRARLLALREKPKDLEPPQADESLEDTYSTQSTDVEILFTEGIAGLKSLSTTNLPLPDESPALQSAIDGLKKFHAALSKQQNPVPGLSVIDLSRLRQIICENLGETMEQLTHLIGFSFDCGDPSINAGLSIPLLSVCLATLMAMFRDADICAIVAQDQLGLLIREAGTALLDPRLSSTSDINEATGSQMVRAINKLAVQAATGAQRHTSLLALMALQQQISLIVNNGTSLEEETFNGRLSRVLTKLFMRVVKAEESNADPFSNNDFDLEAVLCGTEDFLSACKAASECRPMEMVTACRDMITKLAEALLKNRGSSALCGILEDLELLETAEMVAAMTSVADVPIQDEPIQSAPSSSSDDACTGTFSSINNPNSISSLVSALANVKTETERAVALEALREYEQQYGDGDLQAHLQQVSPAFREFIERQMSGTTENAMDGDQQESGSMSERLRQLRTRLAVTEAAVNTAVTMEEITPAVPPSLVGAPATSPPESPETQDAVPTDLGAPTTFAASSRIPTKPSRLAQPSPSKLPISVASQQLRQRLAASAQIRDGMSPLKNPSSPMSRAAALRARLEAVKSTHQSGEDGEVE